MRKRKVFKPRLKTAVDREVLSSVGKRFQASGAATENALSPSLRRVLGTTKTRTSNTNANSDKMTTASEAESDFNDQLW